MTQENFVAALDAAARQHADRTALLLAGGEIWRYADLLDWSERMAAAFEVPRRHGG
jgi:non-ribosomal peptide synthetase component E (peptide arylation enzyme)